MTVTTFVRNASIGELATEIDRRGDVIERLESQIADLTLDRDQWRDREADQAATISRLTAENARKDAALKPFAEAAESYDPQEGDDLDVAWAHDFTIGSLRAARAALPNTAQQDEEG